VAAVPATIRAIVLLGLAVAATALPSVAHADGGILNQLQVPGSGAAGSGVRFSSLTVTSYTDGTISFAVQFANRTYLQTRETVQLFVDLDNDGKADLNLSVWPSFDPSYLSHWGGSDWIDVRQLPELVQSQGSISIRLNLAELRSDAGVPVGSTIGVSVDSYTADTNDVVPQTPDDRIPATGYSHFAINPPAAGAGTTTTGTPAAKPKPVRSKLPVSIEPIRPVTIERDQDATLQIVLESRPGPYRLFKVCAQVPTTVVALHPTQCRSEESAGGNGTLTFKLDYRFVRAGTVRVAISASAGAAKATSTAIVHVKQA
jgi:hypothetical protein